MFTVSPGYRHINGCLHWRRYFQRAHHSHVEGRGGLHPPGWVPLQQLPCHVAQDWHQHPRPQGEKHRHDLIHIHLVIILPHVDGKSFVHAEQTCVSTNVYLPKLWKTQQKCGQVGDDGSILQLLQQKSQSQKNKQTQEGDADSGWKFGGTKNYIQCAPTKFGLCWFIITLTASRCREETKHYAINHVIHFINIYLVVYAAQCTCWHVPTKMFRTISHCVTVFHIVSLHIVSLSCGIVSNHIVSYRTVSCHIVSCM